METQQPIYVCFGEENASKDVVVKFLSDKHPDLKVLHTSADLDDFSSETLLSYILKTVRTKKLLENWRTSFWNIEHHLRALQLCLAREKQQRQGEFHATVSEVVYHHKEYVKCADYGFVPLGGNEDLSRVIALYRKFLELGNASDAWEVLEKFKKLLDENLDTSVNKEVILVIGTPSNKFVQRCLALICNSRPVYRVTTEIPLDLSIREDIFSADIKLDVEPLSLEDITRYSVEPVGGVKPVTSQTMRYIVNIVNSFFRLLVNSRDELALAAVISSPIVSLPHQAFTELKHLSLEQEMPMCQTTISYVVRVKLGGKSYAPKENCPLKEYIKGLDVFVDLFHKLNNIIEEESCKTAINRLINVIFNRLSKATEHGLKTDVLNNIKTSLLTFSDNVVSTCQVDTSEDVQRIGMDTLKVVQLISDCLSTRDVHSEPISILCSPKADGTPINIPSVFGYFHSPDMIVSEEADAPLMERINIPCKTIICKINPFAACHQRSEATHVESVQECDERKVQESADNKMPAHSPLVQKGKKGLIIRELLNDKENKPVPMLKKGPEKRKLFANTSTTANKKRNCKRDKKDNGVSTNQKSITSFFLKM